MLNNLTPFCLKTLKTHIVLSYESGPNVCPNDYIVQLGVRTKSTKMVDIVSDEILFATLGVHKFLRVFAKVTHKAVAFSQESIIDLTMVEEEDGDEDDGDADVPETVAIVAVPPPKQRAVTSLPKAFPARVERDHKPTYRDYDLRRISQYTSVEHRILGALVELEALGISDPSRKMLALLAGYKNSETPGYKKALSTQKTTGHIQYTTAVSTVSITEAGRRAAPTQPIPPSSNDEMHARIKSLLSPKQCQIFDEFSDGRSYSLEQVAMRVGYEDVTSPGCKKAFSSLRSPELPVLEYTKNKNLWLAGFLFPFGRGNP